MLSKKGFFQLDNIIIANILQAIISVVNIYLFFLFIYAILNLLGTFGAIDLFSDGVFSRIYGILKLIIDPLHNFFSRFVPKMGMLDLAFLAMLVSLWIIKDVCVYYLNIIQNNVFAF